MSRICHRLARVRNHVVCAYKLARAHHDIRKQRLRVPTGVWCCDRCGLVMWDIDAYVVHGRAHAK